MSKYLHELCCSIIEDYYGEFYARIYYHLTHNGRYAATQIAQKSHLPLKQVKAGLATLVQLRLIYYHTTQEGSSSYQANTRSTYDVLRSGKLLDLARAEHGDLAVEVLTEAILLGFTSIAELCQRVAISLPARNHAPTNGEVGDEDPRVEDREINTTIQLLLKAGFFTHVRAAQFQTFFDGQKDVELRLKGQGQAPAKGRKGQIEYEDRIDEEVRNRQSVKTAEIGYVPAVSASHKRSADVTEDVAEKRQKMSNGTTSRYSNGVVSTAEVATLIAVNYGNAISCVRNGYLDDIAKKSLGPKFSRVLGSVMSSVPVSDPFNIQNNQYWFDSASILDNLNNSQSATVPNGKHKQNGVHHHDDDDEDRNEYFSHGDLDRHMALLSESLFDFIKGGYSKGQWQVDRKDLVAFVQKQEALRIMGNRLGPPSLRIVRMLMEKGRLDEKTLQETGLLGAKDLRQTLAELSQMGFIDLQEVPREAQRQPNRTIFLWFHDPERVRKVLLEGLYKSMTRLSQRLRKERRELVSTLEKVERSDVKGNEEQMLPTAELMVWKRWQRKEEWMLGELSRLDDSVSLLRDL